MAQRFTNPNDDRLPQTIRKASLAVCQLKTADQNACTATNIGRSLILTAGHTMQTARDSMVMLAVYNLVEGAQPGERQVFTLEPTEEPDGWFVSQRNNSSHNVGNMNNVAQLEFAVCRTHKNIEGHDTGEPPRGIASIAAPKKGVGEAKSIYLVSQCFDDRVQVYGAGVLDTIQDYCFSHTLPAGAGDSGAPIFDSDGNLIGIHVATDEESGVLIACRADKILEKLRANWPNQFP